MYCFPMCKSQLYFTEANTLDFSLALSPLLECKTDVQTQNASSGKISNVALEARSRKKTASENHE